MPEGFQIQHDDVGGRITFPVQQQVGTADVRLVADRNEGGDSNVVAQCVVQNGDSQSPGLAGHGHVATRREHGGKRAVHRNGNVRVENAHAVWSHHPHSGRSHNLEEVALHLLAFFTKFREPGGDHDDAPNALLRTLLDGLERKPGWDDDEGQINRVFDVQDRLVGANRIDDVRLGVDREDRSGEVAFDEVVKEAPADRGPVATGPDYSDRTGVKNGEQRRGHRSLLSLLVCRPGIFRQRHREIDAVDALIQRPLEPVSGISEEPHHLHVLRQHEGTETGDSEFAGMGRHELQQLAADAPVLVPVLDHKCNFRELRVVFGPVVPANGDNLIVVDGHEGHPVFVVDVGEVLQFLWGEILLHPEEPEIPRFGTETMEMLIELLGIVRLDRTETNNAAVAEGEVDLIFGWVVAHVAPCWVFAPILARSGTVGSAILKVGGRPGCSSTERSAPAQTVG